MASWRHCALGLLNAATRRTAMKAPKISTSAVAKSTAPIR